MVSALERLGQAMSESARSAEGQRYSNMMFGLPSDVAANVQQQREYFSNLENQQIIKDLVGGMGSRPITDEQVMLAAQADPELALKLRDMQAQQFAQAKQMEVEAALPDLISQVDINDPTRSLSMLMQAGVPLSTAQEIISIAQKQAQQQSLNMQRQAIFGFPAASSGKAGAQGGFSAMTEEQLVQAATIPELEKAVELEFQRRESFRKREEEEKTKKAKTQTKATGSAGVLDAIENARKIAKGSVTATGVLGQLSGVVGGSPAFDLQEQIDTISASIGFDRLQRMRDESPTGGALGNTSERELDLLKADIASLKKEQSATQFLQNLNKVETRYKNAIKNLKEAYLEDYGTLDGFPLEDSISDNQPSRSQTNTSTLRQQAQEAIAAGVDPGAVAAEFQRMTGEAL